MLILYFQSRASNIGKPVLCLLYNQTVSSNDCIISNNNLLKDNRWNAKEITITYFYLTRYLGSGHQWIEVSQYWIMPNGNSHVQYIKITEVYITT